MMPQGYLTMLYMAIFLPFFFHKMMAKKLLEWDENFASDKERILAITKCDMLDEELKAELSQEFPKDIQVVCISSIANMGILALKDLIWKIINS